MPTVYVDAPFRRVIREEVERLQRDRGDTSAPDTHVPEREGLECLLGEDAKRRIKKKRENWDS